MKEEHPGMGGLLAAICLDAAVTCAWHLATAKVLRSMKNGRVSFRMLSCTVRLLLSFYSLGIEPDVMCKVSIAVNVAVGSCWLFEHEKPSILLPKGVQNLEYWILGGVHWFVRRFPHVSESVGISNIKLEPHSLFASTPPLSSFSPLRKKHGRRRSLGELGKKSTRNHVKRKSWTPLEEHLREMEFVESAMKSLEALSRRPTVPFAPPLRSSGVLIVGSPKFHLHVPERKWNEGILFWAKPSLQKYFESKYGGIPTGKLNSPRFRPHFAEAKRSVGFISSISPKKEQSSEKRFIRAHAITDKVPSKHRSGNFKPRSGSLSASFAPSWSALDSFIYRGDSDLDEDDDDEQFGHDEDFSSSTDVRPVRGTVLIRGDGVLLSINPSPPNVHEIFAIAKKNKKCSNGEEDSKEYLAELVGRTIKCRTGPKTMYTYAEYASFGLGLTPPTKITLLWLLRRLNGDLNIENLRFLRTSNFIESGLDNNEY